MSRPKYIPSLKPSCAMEDALTPEQCNKVSTFLNALVMASDNYKIPVGKFLAAYRVNMNGYHHKHDAPRVPCKTRQQAVELRRTTKMSYREIGEALGVSQATASEYGRYVERG